MRCPKCNFENAPLVEGGPNYYVTFVCSSCEHTNDYMRTGGIWAEARKCHICKKRCWFDFCNEHYEQIPMKVRKLLWRVSPWADREVRQRHLGVVVREARRAGANFSVRRLF